MSFIDLSHHLEHDESVYPGDPAFSLDEIRSIEKDGFSDFLLNSGMHVGTHIDAPSHMISDGKCISDYPLDKFSGNAIIIDVRNVQYIDVQHLLSSDIQSNDIVLLHTGFDRYYGYQSYYNNHPIISMDLAQWLVHKGVKLLGMDMPSPDYSPYHIHLELLRNDILLVENLTNLSALDYNKHYPFYAFPMPLSTSATWTRAVVNRR